MKVRNKPDIFASVDVRDNPQTPKVLAKVGKMFRVPVGTQLPRKTITVTVAVPLYEIGAFLARSAKKKPEKFMAEILNDRLYQAWRGMELEQAKKSVPPKPNAKPNPLPGSIDPAHDDVPF
jgi:hypothetical protein